MAVQAIQEHSSYKLTNISCNKMYSQMLVFTDVINLVRKMVQYQ